MLKRTERIFKRKVAILGTETVKVVTYWLLGIIPVFSTEQILSSTELR